MDNELTVAAVEAIAEGRVKTAKTKTAFALIAKRAGHYEVECGWVVPEAHDDDYLSSTYHPFAADRMCPWVGRRVVTADPVEARDVYLAYKADVFARRVPARGEIIGSVTREAV